MPSKDNLIPLNERSIEDAKIIRSKGGKARQEQRNRRKAIKETLEMVLSLPVTDQREWNRLVKEGVEPNEINQQVALVLAIINGAKKKGNASDLKIITELLGEINYPAIMQDEHDDDPITAALKGESFDADER